ncbi:AAA family ATPase [Paenibacillus oleatilyticus]|uniref:AAA family ATPase n=1 Tax=Paenibacillus oleatilyticus TaxID=2594886 RepID=UPI001C1F9455|nr:AAA family ATPase [Paenibacillus oleatilyticus]MBU7314434.1 AAA family ATPase [Paenibacillus oleatilyticus]
MDYHIKEIIIDKDSLDGYQMVGKDNNNLANLSKINLFVGSNNSGKSRFVRSLFNYSTYSIIPAKVNLPQLNSLIDAYKKDVESIIERFGIVDYGDTVSILSKITNNNFIKSEDEYLANLFTSIDFVRHVNTDQAITKRSLHFSFYEDQHIQLRQDLNSIGNDYYTKIRGIIGSSPEKYSFKKVYIPTLRGLRPFDNDFDYYSQRTKQDYFPSIQDMDEIFSGLEMYQKVKELLLGDLQAREKISDFQKFLGDAFFDGQQVALIPSINSDVLNVKIGKEKEQPIYNLGDGIQSIIILTFPLFINKEENLLVFIEEPELYLHPGLQRKLIETFMSFSNFQYFITTHSNHFLDITLDVDVISIYTFRKQFENESQTKEVTANFVIENASNENSGILEMIGVKNSSVFLSNCTIWVEGITDRFYLRHYLRLYMQSLPEYEKKNFKEDLHYSFVEYSGGNITHWSFLDDGNSSEDETYREMNADRLCGRLFLITDKDSEGKIERQRKLKKKLGKRYYCLDCREIENLISKHVLLDVIAEYECIQVDQLRFKTEFSEPDYKEIYLGSYIDSQLINRKRRAKYGSDSGTVSDKLRFCKRAISYTQRIDDISPEGLKVVKKIYNFIMEQNQ